MISKECSVKTEIISSEDFKKTFSVKKTIEGAEGKDGIIIQLNPTVTAEETNNSPCSSEWCQSDSAGK